MNRYLCSRRCKTLEIGKDYFVQLHIQSSLNKDLKVQIHKWNTLANSEFTLCLAIPIIWNSDLMNILSHNCKLLKSDTSAMILPFFINPTYTKFWFNIYFFNLCYPKFLRVVATELSTSYNFKFYEQLVSLLLLL